MLSDAVHDRDLLDALAALQPVPYVGETYRASGRVRSPLVGSLSGGRWAPPQSFETLYTSLDPVGAIAELFFHYSRQPIFPSADVTIHTLDVETQKTLHFADLSDLERLGVDIGSYASLDYSRCQQIGAAVYFLEYDGLIVPNARYSTNNLIIFLDRLPEDCVPCVIKSELVNWKEWRISFPDLVQDFERSHRP